MNILLWVLQVLLAIHTAIGAVWKFSHSAGHTMPSLKAIPGGAWLGMSILELLIAVFLVVPAIYMPAASLVPMAAICILVEMLLYCVLHLTSGDTSFGPMIYWLVVAALCGFIAYGRLQLSPL